MSLSSFLEEKDVKERFKEEFPLPNFKAQIKREMLVQPLTDNRQLVGIAFDYLLRFYIKYLNPHATQQNQWIAEIAVARLKQSKFHHLYKQACVNLNQAKENYTAFQNTGQFTDDLLKSTLLLGKLDPFVRGRAIDKNLQIDENLQFVDNSDVQDLRRLIELVEPTIFQSEKPIILNPTWGKDSLLVGGADGDLIIGDLLVDIKTIKDFTLVRKTFNQLMGYYTLSMLNQAREPSALEVLRLGIYFSRFGFLYEFNVSEVVNPKTWTQFVEWFFKRALSNRPVT